MAKIFTGIIITTAVIGVILFYVVFQNSSKTEVMSLDDLFVGQDIGENLSVVSIKPYDESSEYAKRFGFGRQNYEVQLSGQITLSGQYVKYADLELIHFLPDDASRKKLPMLYGKERRIFSFRNNDFAANAFRHAGEKGSAVVVVKNYTIKEFPAEIADSAELVQVLKINSSNNE